MKKILYFMSCVLLGSLCTACIIPNPSSKTSQLAKIEPLPVYPIITNYYDEQARKLSSTKETATQIIYYDGNDQEINRVNKRPITPSTSAAFISTGRVDNTESTDTSTTMTNNQSGYVVPEPSLSPVPKTSTYYNQYGVKGRQC